MKLQNMSRSVSRPFQAATLLRRTVSIIGFVVGLGAASVCFGQITGGYGAADTKDKEVKAAAAFAVGKLATDEAATIKLTRINSARLQVVAGINYELCLEITVKRGEKRAARRYVKAVVYRNLKNAYKLTNWTISTDPLSCEE